MKKYLSSNSVTVFGGRVMVSKQALAQCVGLWLAEGDDKTIAEITFTNNNLELVKLFKQTIGELFPGLNPRVYVYSKTKSTFAMDGVVVKSYIDKRATRPYCIYRVASREATK